MNSIRRCLMEMDVPGIRAAWAKQAPHLPQPASDAEAEICLHHARTQARSIPLMLRGYSHRWLVERGYPSGLPERLKPRVDRLDLRVSSGVGIFVVATSPVTRPIRGLVRDAMSDAVLECYADGHENAEIVRPRMLEARNKAVKQLVGIRMK